MHVKISWNVHDYFFVIGAYRQTCNHLWRPGDGNVLRSGPLRSCISTHSGIDCEAHLNWSTFHAEEYMNIWAGRRPYPETNGNCTVRIGVENDAVAGAIAKRCAGSGAQPTGTKSICSQDWLPLFDPMPGELPTWCARINRTPTIGNQHRWKVEK